MAQSIFNLWHFQNIFCRTQILKNSHRLYMNWYLYVEGYSILTLENSKELGKSFHYSAGTQTSHTFSISPLTDIIWFFNDFASAWIVSTSRKTLKQKSKKCCKKYLSSPVPFQNKIACWQNLLPVMKKSTL